MACTVHFFVHIIQAIIFRKYIPAVITSIISMTSSVWIILKVLDCFSDYLSGMYTFMVIGFIIVFLNLIFAHRLMGIFTSYINKNGD